MSRTARAEIITSLVIIAACIAAIVESLKLPPGSFEPLGSAPVPQATAGLIIALCCLVIVAALRRPKQPEEETGEEVAPTLLFALTTLAYAAALHSRKVDFGVLTAAFLVITVWGMARFSRTALLPAVLIALIIGFGIKYLFTQVFVVDLPVWWS